MHRKRIRMLCMLTLAAVLGAGAADCAFAATHTYSTEVENNITTGDINISLAEYELTSDGQEVLYQDNKKVVPGEVVSKIPRIRNEAESAWIRAKVEYNSDSGLEGMDDSMLSGISDLWIKRGDYFYYTEPLENSQSVDFFRSVMIPMDWNEEAEKRKFTIGITVQAIQSANFSPDFQSNDPWFGVPIEACIHDSHDIYQVENKQEFSIIFENGAEGFVKTGKDFFENFPSMMPGDTVTDSVEIGSQFYRIIDISFRTEIPEQSEEAKELLDKLELIIKNDNEIIYEGTLAAKDLQDGILLADGLRRGEIKNLSYSIRMPEDLNNAYAMREAKVRWIFTAEYRTSSGGGGGGGSTTYKVTHSDPGEEPETITPTPVDPYTGTPDAEDVGLFELPKTGDSSMEIGFIISVMFVFGCGIVVLLLLRRKESKQEGIGKEGEGHDEK